jgi:hypothetical protein
MRIQVETKSERRTAPKAKHSSGRVHVLDRLSILISNHLERLKVRPGFIKESSPEIFVDSKWTTMRSSWVFVLA